MNLATAFVEIRADTSKGEADVRRAVDEMSRAVATVTVDVDDAGARSTVKKFTGDVDQASADVTVGVDDQATAPMRGIEAGADKLDSVDPTVTVDANDQASSDLEGVHREAAKVDADHPTVTVDANDQASSDLEGVRRKADEVDSESPTVTVTAETEQARRQVDQLGDEVEKLPERSKSVIAQMTEIFGAAAFIKGISDAIGKASDLNETVSKTGVIFGQSADDITAWSQNSAKQFGLSQQAALDASATFATFGKGAGLAGQDLTGFSEKLVGLASDLASFYNTSPEQAIEAIGAALRGESEPIRAYGVLLDDATLKQQAMTMGLYDGTGTLDQHAKVLAAQAVILKQTSDAQGDFARTADGLANSQRIAKAEAENSAASLGQSFLPVYKVAVQLVGDLAKGFGALPKPVQLGVVGLAGFAALAGPIKSMVGVTKDLAGGIKTLVLSASGLGPIALGIGVVAGAFVAAFAVQETQQDRVTEATKRYTAAIQAATAGTKDAVLQQIQADISQGDFLATAEKLGLAVGDIAKIITGESVPAFDNVKSTLTDLLDVGVHPTDQAVQLLSDKFGIGVGQAQAFLDRVTVLTAGLENGKKAAEAAGIVTDQLTNALTDSTTETTHMAGEAARLGAIQTGTADATDTATAAMVAQAGAVPPLLDAFGELTDSQNRQGEAAREGTGQNQAWADQQEIAANRAKDHKTAVDALVDSLGDEHSLLDGLTAAANELKAALDAVTGGSRNMESANRAVQAASDDLTNSYSALGKKGTDLKDVQARVAAGLDITTEAGRSNREQVEKSAQSILDYGVAAVGAGASNEQAAASMNLLTGQLRTQLEQAGFTEDQVNEYLDTLGLTPDKISTSIEIAGTEEARKELAARQTDLDKLSEGALAEIQTDVDEGDYQAALAKLNLLTAPRSVLVSTKVDGVGKGGVGGVQASVSALGRFVPANTNLLTTVAEPGAGDEAVLPLQNRSRLQQLLDDPRIGGPVGDALGDAGGITSGGDTYTGIVNNYGQSATVDDVNRAFLLARMSR